MTIHINSFVGTDSIMVAASERIIQIDDTLDLIAYARDSSGNPVSNVTAAFYKEIASTRSNSGSATTNSSGIARQTEGYTATGAGKVEFSATASIGGTTEISSDFEVIDAFFFDEAIISNNQDWNGKGGIVVERGDNYTTLSPSNVANLAWTYHSPSNTSNVCIEFDLLLKASSTSINILTLREGSSVQKQYSAAGIGVSVNKWYHIRVEVASGQVTVYNGTDRKQGPSAISTWNRVQLQIPANTDAVLQYRNFVVYSL